MGTKQFHSRARHKLALEALARANGKHGVPAGEQLPRRREKRVHVASAAAAGEHKTTHAAPWRAPRASA